MAVSTSSTSTSKTSRTKADGYATIVVVDKNGGNHKIESQDAWLFAQKNTGETNDVNTSLLKLAQANREVFQKFQELGNKERAAIIAKGEEPKPYFEVPAVVQIKVPMNQLGTEEQADFDF